MSVRPVIEGDYDPLHHLSNSGADTFETCARQWHAKYVLQLPDPSGPEATIGSMAHLVLERISVFPPGRRTPEVAGMLADRLWAGKSVGQRRLAMGHVLRGLRNLDVAHGDAALVEQDLEVELGGVPFKGFLDRADSLPSDALQIMDYKTGKRKPGRNNVYLIPKRRQVTLYAAAVEALFGRPVHRVAILWTANGKVDEWDVNDVEIAEVVRWLRHVWDDINDAFAKDDFPPNPGALCSWCPALNGCTEGRAAVVERAADKTKSIGSYGIAVLDDIRLKEWEATLAATGHKHLSVVPDVEAS